MRKYKCVRCGFEDTIQYRCRGCDSDGRTSVPEDQLAQMQQLMAMIIGDELAGSLRRSRRAAKPRRKAAKPRPVQSSAPAPPVPLGTTLRIRRSKMEVS